MLGEPCVHTRGWPLSKCGPVPSQWATVGEGDSAAGLHCGEPWVGFLLLGLHSWSGLVNPGGNFPKLGSPALTVPHGLGLPGSLSQIHCLLLNVVLVGEVEVLGATSCIVGGVMTTWHSWSGPGLWSGVQEQIPVCFRAGAKGPTADPGERHNCTGLSGKDKDKKR